MHKNILVTGGAGYIGSHCVQALLAQGYNVVVLDNLSTGHAQAVLGAPLVELDLRQSQLLQDLFTQHKFDAVLHFAASSIVPESMRNPEKYFDNNVGSAICLLKAMAAAGCQHFILSSTASVYGEPQQDFIDESHPKNPLNTYGLSKWMIECMLPFMERAHGIKSVCLRYFNAAGAHGQLPLGEDHWPETHLIPNIFRAALGKSAAIELYGTDYTTPDGTALRDYIHVMDLCSAHILALRHLLNAGQSTVYNVGSSSGFSVRQVIEAAQKVSGKKIPVVLKERRAGDPARLIASSRKIQTELGWQMQYGLEDILASAWHWHNQYPDGFKNLS